MLARGSVTYSFLCGQVCGVCVFGCVGRSWCGGVSLAEQMPSGAVTLPLGAVTARQSATRLTLEVRTLVSLSLYEVTCLVCEWISDWLWCGIFWHHMSAGLSCHVWTLRSALEGHIPWLWFVSTLRARLWCIGRCVYVCACVCVRVCVGGIVVVRSKQMLMCTCVENCRNLISICYKMQFLLSYVH